jgi:DNA polymerase III alpha subunit
MKVNTDVDIDVYDRDELLSGLRHVVASMKKDGVDVKHNTGVYFQSMPRNPLTNLATINYEEAEELGYFKIDFLNNSVYKGVKNEQHLVELASAEPMWDMLEDEQIVENLFHIGNHAELVVEMRPRSVEELAMLLAVIRPGKAHLRGEDWDTVRAEVWEKPTDGSYYFKKSHSFGYAMAIVVQMNLMVEKAMHDV